MELWQLDVMGGIWLTDGGELKAVTGIDDHSRFCVMAGLIERANAAAVCRVFTQALERYGSPELLTDNGKVFTGRLGPHPAEVLFDRICREHGITHRCTGVRCPTTTGKIERFHKTLRAELLTGRRFDSLDHAQQVLDGWVADYSAGRHLAGQIVTVQLHPTVLQVFFAGQLIRTVPHQHQGGGPAPSPPAQNHLKGLGCRVEVV
jgi:transposase InsO family protein